MAGFWLCYALLFCLGCFSAPVYLWCSWRVGAPMLTVRVEAELCVKCGTAFGCW